MVWQKNHSGPKFFLDFGAGTSGNRINAIHNMYHPLHFFLIQPHPTREPRDASRVTQYQDT